MAKFKEDGGLSWRGGGKYGGRRAAMLKEDGWLGWRDVGRGKLEKEERKYRG